MTTTVALRFILLATTLAAAVAGCATAVDDGSEGLPASEMPTCAANEASLSGTVDGAKVEAPAARVVSRTFADADSWGHGGYLDIDLDSGDHITLAWDEPLHDGGAAAATGVLDSTTASYASCVDESLLGLVWLDRRTGSIYFQLPALQRDGLCDGPVAEGELTGCIGPAPVPLAE